MDLELTLVRKQILIKIIQTKKGDITGGLAVLHNEEPQFYGNLTTEIR
jgi:hypothetical protein